MRHLKPNNIIVEGFFDFLKRPTDLDRKKKDIFNKFKECLSKGMELVYYNYTRFDTTDLEIEAIKKKSFKLEKDVYVIINDDLSVSFSGDVKFTHFKGPKVLPFLFYEVDGNFTINASDISLKCVPKIVGENLDISDNSYDSLDDLNVDYIGGEFNCSSNYLRVLKNLPNINGGYINADANHIYTYEGISFDNLKKLSIYMNPINSIHNLLYYLKSNEDDFDMFNDFDIFRPGDKALISSDRFAEFINVLKVRYPDINSDNDRRVISLDNVDLRFYEII